MRLKPKQTATFNYKPFSRKQKQLLTWWCDKSPVKDMDGIIADGAIRSGKTISMSLSFVLWAMTVFNGQNFGMCGKTVGSFRKNVLFWLKLMLKGRGYKVHDVRSDNYCIVSNGNVTNYFYIYGGKDERSQDLIQGMTFAGVFLDEVALMPESFVNQATGRCSVDGSKMWFNCNPSSPSHWFKVKWIDKAKDKRLLYLHFTMDDNLSLTERTKSRYRTMYTGVFYDRFILGLWVMAQGLIYPMYKDAFEEVPEGKKPEQYAISIDYGTMNAFAVTLWGRYGDIWWGIDEYYYSGREQGVTKTDDEYFADIEDWLKDIDGRLYTVIDPSAASFIALLRKNTARYNVKKAKNDVIKGIEQTMVALQRGIIKFSPKCKNTKKEFEGYVWDDSETEDKPVKINDHAMDNIRYFVATSGIASAKTQYQATLY